MWSRLIQMVGWVHVLPITPITVTVTSTRGKNRFFSSISPCILGSRALGNSAAPVIMKLPAWNIASRRITSAWSGGGGSVSTVRMPPMRPLLNRPSGTPFSGTAPGSSGSALMFFRWKNGSASFIVSRIRTRTCISAVRRWYAVRTSTLLHTRAPAVPRAIAREDNSNGWQNWRRGVGGGQKTHQGEGEPERLHLPLVRGAKRDGRRRQGPGGRGRNGDDRGRCHPPEHACDR